jgi:hypothetical protein
MSDHLKSTGETYLTHLKEGLLFSLSLLLASVVGLIHSFFPFIFKNTASSIAWLTLKRVIARSSTARKIHIRYNTKRENTDFYWRVFVDGQQHLAKDVKIFTPAWGEKSILDGDVKLNIACIGHITWESDVATIRGELIDRVS